MKPLSKLGETQDAQGSIWELWERDGIYTLMQDGVPCASSFTHGSEQCMAELAITPIARAGQPQILIAGLGLGYSLAKAMEQINRDKAKFIVAEPVPAIIKWNREFGAAKELLDDPRVTIELAEAAELCTKRTGSLHAILLKHTHKRCNMSVTEAQAYFNALKGGSMLAITLSKGDRKLEATLRRAGFDVSFTVVPEASKGKQQRMHSLILARRGRFVPFAENSRGGRR